jgi:hypothetical protein
MRTVIIFFLLASPVFAQSAVTAAAPTACGPVDVKFDVKPDPAPPHSELPSGKAFIYVIEDVGESATDGLRSELDSMDRGLERTAAIAIFHSRSRPASNISVRIGSQACGANLLFIH